jgi:hypothetical protein
MARASEPRLPSGPRLGRRALLAAGAGWVATLALAPVLRPRPARAEGLPGPTRRLLETSGFVYVSPLRADGSESTCHGEVWYGWLDGAVVLITARDAWKSRALARGLDRARIWVGDHGRWKQLLGRNEAFREAPHFEARAERSEDAALLDRLMRTYRTKYPEEIGTWEPRMRAGFASGERWLLRYVPT